MEYAERILSPNVLSGKMDELKRKYQQLESKKEDIEQELKNELVSSFRKIARKEAENWIANVRRTKAKVEELEQKVSTSTYLERKLRIEGEVDSLTREITELTAESKFERGLTLETYDGEGVTLLTTRLIGVTFAENKKRILDCLLEGNDLIVGLYGMGGVGKTTLITHIHNELLRYQNIYVSWVTVSRNFSIKKLQHDIAKTIHLDISRHEDERKRAGLLADALERKKNLILILDDVWDDISLLDVGICVGENVWKLVLTTRSLEVCRRLNCEILVKVEPLTEVEAWTLFAETLRNEALLSNHRINRIAELLVRECGGLQLGIVVMARSMRGVDDIHEWNNALEEIREAKYRSEDMGFYDQVFLVLRYSYDKLKDPKVKECLLHCSLYSEESLIERDELIEYLIDENLIDGRSSRQSAVEKGHTILNKLENVSLLEAHWANKKRCVKMHDLVRDMAIKITNESHNRFLVQAGMRLRELPNEEEWSEDLARVSLMYNNISHIPSNVSPRCPRLLTLMLHENRLLKVIPDNFFVHMKVLKVLDLSYTRIESLPTSIANLESLTALRLRGCSNLKVLQSFENLTLLRKLDLSGTSIEEVPKGMEKLTSLRYLNLDKCKKLKKIPDGILPQLSQMEWFKSDLSFRLRGRDVDSWRKLETFYGNFHDVGDFITTCEGSWEETGPNQYTILVGYDERRPDPTTCYQVYYEKHVHVLTRNDYREDSFCLPSGLEFLMLERCNGIGSLSHITTLKNSAALRRCDIMNCDSVRNVICSCCVDVLFPKNLQILKLWHLPKLTDLVERDTKKSVSFVVPVVDTFSSLKELYIIGCKRLEILFQTELLGALRCLRRLNVQSCDELREIVAEGHEEATSNTIIVLPNLRSLGLYWLRKLKSICDYSIKLSDSLEFLSIVACPEVKRMTLLWDEPHPPKSLETMVVSKKWWDLVEWKHPQTKIVLQPYVKFSQ